MLEHLKKTNPARVWEKKAHIVSVPLANGDAAHTVCCPVMTLKQWDAFQVMEHYSNCILVDPDQDFGLYLSIASEMAISINAHVKGVRVRIITTCLLADKVIESLTSMDYELARGYLADLAVTLVADGKETEPIWTEWFTEIDKFLDV